MGIDVKKIFNTIAGILRTVGLWILILGDLGMLSIWAYNHQWVWFSVGLGITLWIVGWEIFGSTVGFKQPDGTRKKMTISTAYRNYLEVTGAQGYMALFCFIAAMLGLGIHLAFYGGMFK